MFRDELVREMKADAALGADRARQHDQQIEAARDLPAPEIAGGGRSPVVRAERPARPADRARGLDDLRGLDPGFAGGERRQDSVRAGLDRIDRDAKYVAVHDAARPLITPEQIERAFEQCHVHGAAALAQPVNDTLKRADAALLVVGSVDRHQIYAMQTPQIFERELIEDAYSAVYAENISVTDEVSAVERLGHKIALVLNDDFNFKITYPRDLPVADFILRERAKDRR